MSVLMNAPTRAVDALCVRDCELVQVSQAAFARILQRYPTVLKHFTQLLAKRYQEVTDRVAHTPNMSRPRVKPTYVTIAVVPAGRTAPPLGAFSLKLVQALGAVGSVMHISSTKIDDALGAGISDRMHQPFERARVTQWISTQEESYRFLVFESDLGLTPWSRICVEHADCVLLVGLGHTPPELSDIEREYVFHAQGAAVPLCPETPRTKKRNLRGKLWDLLDGSKSNEPLPPTACKARSFSRKELVLLYPVPSRRPQGTRRWLRLRRVGWHHHVRTPYFGDFARVARHVSGTARGLVLGGGGARGLAHIGVLKVMECRGIDVDLIGGTSQGAYMAAAYASTMNLEAAEQRFDILKRIASPLMVLSSLTFPIVSYFEGSTFNELLQDAFGDTQIEDLWIRYFCVTTNVSKARQQIHTVGPLWKYARASMTVLGLLPPMYDQGSLLVDGGYLNNLPVDVMRKFAPQMSEVVAVDVENKDNSMFENVDDFGNSLSGWWVLMKLLLSWCRVCKPVALPSMSNVTLSLCYMSHTINIRHLLRQGRADDSIVYIQPDVQTYGLLEYGKRPEIVRKGEVEAEKVFEELQTRRRDRLACGEGEEGAELEPEMNSMLSLHRFSMLDLHQNSAPVFVQVEREVAKGASTSRLRASSSSHPLVGRRK